ncbi:MAG: phosphoribosyltransferase [Chloroflexota bacterium]|nr:MAG: phosphoribosyltransferase [Chloroflexota bacterium]
MICFTDRRDAGKRLAAKLTHYKNNPSANVLGIPRGGVVVAQEIARALDVPLDVFITRKLGAPMNAELAIGAVASDGAVLLDQQLIQQLHISPKFIEHERAKQMREMQRRLEMYRRGKPPLGLQNKIVILVDDGIATGATVFAALRALKNQNPTRVILAVPVAPRQVLPQLRAACDELELLDAPEPFVAVGYFYQDFEQVADEEVVRILSEAER